MREKHPLAGKTVILNCKPDPDSLNGQMFTIEDWWQNVAGKSWMACDGNPACLKYAMRSALAGLPIDNEVLYGKVGASGHLVHVSEIGEEAKNIEFRGMLLEDVLYCNPRKTKIPPSFDDILKYGRPGGPKIVRYRKGEWVYGSLVTNGSKCWIVGKVTDASDECISFESWFPVDPATVGQYIGLKDKDGAKIYTGDIIDCVHWFFDGNEMDEHFTAFVGFRDGSFTLEGIKSRFYSNYTGEKDGEGICPIGMINFNSDDYRVIGSRWDNPELLGVK